MNRSGFLLIALIAASPAAPKAAAAAVPAGEAQIHFADHGGIWDWDVVDRATLLIEDRSRRWYKAKLATNCLDLPFEQKIGFESNADGTFDKFSAIQTRQRRCPLSSLTRTEAPAKKSKKAAGPAAVVKPMSAIGDMSGSEIFTAPQSVINVSLK